MNKIISIHDAKIKTVSIGIKALTISDKQVTLSVFRQLQEEALINESGTLNGIPWGWVNYHPDKCGDMRSHKHVVWQSGDELRRSLIYNEPSFDNHYGSGAANDYMKIKIENIARGLLGVEPMPSIPYPGGICYWRRGEGLVPVKAIISGDSQKIIDFFKYERKAESRPTGADETSYNARVKAWEEKMKSNGYAGDGYVPYKYKNPAYGFPAEPQKHLFASDEIEGLNSLLKNSRALSLEMAGHKLDKEIKAEIARRERWKRTTGELASLPQLFVAV